MKASKCASVSGRLSSFKDPQNSLLETFTDSIFSGNASKQIDPSNKLCPRSNHFIDVGKAQSSDRRENFR